MLNSNYSFNKIEMLKHTGEAQEKTLYLSYHMKSVKLAQKKIKPLS